MIQIVPAVIPQNFEEIKERIEKVKGKVPKFQIDFADGKFVKTKTWPFNLTEEPKHRLDLPWKDEIIIEADLLIKDPEDFLDDFVAIGVRSFVIHVDSTHYINKCIHDIKEKGLQVGLGIKPKLDTGVLEEFLDKADFVQFMGNDVVGYNGVGLDHKVLKKIYDFNSLHPFVPIQVDIGVNFETAPELIKVGAESLISGSAVFNGDVAKNIEKLKYGSTK